MSTGTANLSPSGLPHSRCENCRFLAWCLPANLTSQESKQFNARIKHRRLIKRNEYLHHAGYELTSLYVINNGCIKTSITDSGGREQITGFSTAGELVGMDAIGAGKHECNAVAIENSLLCGMRYSDFKEFGHAIPALQRHFHRAMGAEIARNHQIMFSLRSMQAEGRVAMFLLNLSAQISASGHSKTPLRVSMTRKDIGNYLGLKLETVSRVFSRFKNVKLIAIAGKNVEIKNPIGLQQIVGGYDTHRSLPRRTKFGTH